MGIAAYNEGINYYNGSNGFPFDYHLAYKRFLEAAKTNNLDAIYMLGVMYKEGQGVMIDYSKAVRLLNNAANQGHTMSKIALGDMYYFGLGVPKNARTAYDYYSAGVDERHAGACFMSGIIALENLKDYEWAFRLFCTTVSMNYNVKESYYNLGLICEKGKGPTPGIKNAYGYYLRSAELGFAAGMFATARMLQLKGFKSEAIEWAERAVENGCKEAKNWLFLIRL